ncbi:hypothetical protein [Parenemella sanctibonifatiensis]|uniref:Uncharacterized protein n=1 Tax=Parenemella sanctibonifatiensis TaxID=2016505 RepID=A0A255ER07_9ACTN|nr:hypothetical protein [Parenemella sanctibonifatiensis]OYN92035.1 hypothetical protein CGZ91_00450 [Parenemella sanctibonifatiensis]
MSVPVREIRVVLWELPIMGAFGRGARRWAGYGPAKSALAVAAKKLALPVAWLVQQPLIEKRVMRLMWGPDGVELIQQTPAGADLDATATCPG